MFLRLLQKELLHHLLDHRFVATFALCGLLSVLSVYVGTQNYLLQLRDHDGVTEANRNALRTTLENKNLNQLLWVGYDHNPPPEVLSPLVHGLSGTLGREAHVYFQYPVEFEFSLFETDPIHGIFGVLDFAFVVRVILSLAVLLFTFDAVCGEKEAGTLRLYVSFSVRRSTLAAAKLAGSALAVLVPFLFAALLSCAILALSPGLGLETQDWIRVGLLMGIFALYLAVFASFGIWVSALTHRRVTSFLILLGLWTVWLFVVPNMAVRAARILSPAESAYAVERETQAHRWEIQEKRRSEAGAFWEGLGEMDWDALSEARRQAIRDEDRRIHEKWDAALYPELLTLKAGLRNQVRRQWKLAALLASISPVGAATLASMDLARTGVAVQERREDALSVHLTYFAGFLREKQGEPWREAVLTDFVPFSYQDRESAGTCLLNNAITILNLVALAALGFAGAFVAMLRYDVR